MANKTPFDELFDFMPRTTVQPPAAVPAADADTGNALTPWQALWCVLVVHAQELADQGVIDDAGLATVARSLDAVRLHRPGRAMPLVRTMTDLEQRVDSQLPGEFHGVTTLGLSRESWQATAVRLIWRQATGLAMADSAGLHRDVVELAESHTMSLMPAFMAGQPAQPTMLGHFLGGAIAPVAAAMQRLVLAEKALDHSPLGAGLLVGEMIDVDRERMARALGFGQPVGNTFDAVANIEDYVAVLVALAGVLAPVHRMLREFSQWIRTSPNSLVLASEWERQPEPAVPTLTIGDRLEALLDRLGQAIRRIGVAVQRMREFDYAPLGFAHEILLELGTVLMAEIRDVLGESREFLVRGVVINRAWLGNRAGRGYTTAGDLAGFLMTEEQLPPSVARAIAAMVAGKLREQSLETSAVTQEMIDSAALMLLGREIKVEIETLGRYLAPRRYLERRQVTGSAAAEPLLAWLQQEKQRIAAVDAPFDVFERLTATVSVLADSAAGE